VISCQTPDNATPNRQSDYTRPETHQNLIHPDKEQNRRLMTINAAAMVLLKNNAATIS
jgi:hypothetical protein